MLPRWPLALLPLLLAGTALADNPTASLSISNGKFEPHELTVPAGQKVELHIHNGDQKPAEFESDSLHREKVVLPGKDIVVYVGPLRAGSYDFFDDFNPSNRGVLVAK
jgi:Cupredoxin-like domain